MQSGPIQSKVCVCVRVSSAFVSVQCICVHRHISVRPSFCHSQMDLSFSLYEAPTFILKL